VILGGNGVESEEIKEGPPKGQYGRCRKAWERVLVVAKGFQGVRTPAKNDVPTRDTRTSRVFMYNVRWMRKLYQQCKQQCFPNCRCKEQCISARN
jgi:hypothetical protein